MERILSRKSRADRESECNEAGRTGRNSCRNMFQDDLSHWECQGQLCSIMETAQKAVVTTCGPSHSLPLPLCRGKYCWGKQHEIRGYCTGWYCCGIDGCFLCACLHPSISHLKHAPAPKNSMLALFTLVFFFSEEYLCYALLLNYSKLCVF